MKLIPLPVLSALICPFIPLGAEIINDAPPLPVLKPGTWDTLKLTWTKPEAELNALGAPIGNVSRIRVSFKDTGTGLKIGRAPWTPHRCLEKTPSMLRLLSLPHRLLVLRR